MQFYLPVKLFTQVIWGNATLDFGTCKTFFLFLYVIFGLLNAVITVYQNTGSQDLQVSFCSVCLLSKDIYIYFITTTTTCCLKQAVMFNAQFSS